MIRPNSRSSIKELDHAFSVASLALSSCSSPEVALSAGILRGHRYMGSSISLDTLEVMTTIEDPCYHLKLQNFELMPDVTYATATVDNFTILSNILARLPLLQSLRLELSSSCKESKGFCATIVNKALEATTWLHLKYPSIRNTTC